MKFTFFFFIMLICLSFIIDKGVNGIYYLKGKAFYNSKIINKGLIKIIKNDKYYNIKTDKYGNYNIKIQWELPCLSGLIDQSEDNVNQFTKSFNSEYIIMEYNHKVIKFKNVYEMFIGVDSWNEDDLSYCEDLKF
jgi:hypothetical protein